jgi:hypothetical protein
VQITVSNIPGGQRVVIIDCQGRTVPTREVVIHPKKAALPFVGRSGGYYDELEAHLFEPLYTIRRIWDRQGIVHSVGLVILLHFALEGRRN